MVERKDRFILLSKFEKLHSEKTGSKPVINKYNEQWAADALLESFSKEDIYNAMVYYFQINQKPTWKGFANNVDRLLQSMKAKEEDERLRALMRKKAREWMSG